MKGVAFCPAHVTGFFKAEIEKEKSKQIGSLGAGFSIQNGVTTTVEAKKSGKKDYQLEVSGYKPDNINVSKFLINTFLDHLDSNYFLKIHHQIDIPVGYGLGCSGAIALSLAIALNKALNMGFSETEVGQIAHDAEICCKTGLGDVIASYYGGFEIRTKSGAPGIGIVKKIPTNDIMAIMICFSPISTPQFMKERLSSISGFGGKLVDRLIQSKSYHEFQDMSLEFAKYVKVLTPRMNKVISELHENGIKCGVALFGETVFSLVSQEQEQKVLAILNKYNDGIIIQSKIDSVGARLAQ